MLTLQFRAFRVHRHRSFLLLSVATVSGILYLPYALVASPALRAIPSAESAYHLGSTAFVGLQMFLGAWGTASLFRSYAKLASSAAALPTDARTPNKG